MTFFRLWFSVVFAQKHIKLVRLAGDKQAMLIARTRILGYIRVHEASFADGACRLAAGSRVAGSQPRYTEVRILLIRAPPGAVVPQTLAPRVAGREKGAAGSKTFCFFECLGPLEPRF